MEDREVGGVINFEYIFMGFRQVYSRFIWQYLPVTISGKEKSYFQVGIVMKGLGLKIGN